MARQPKPHLHKRQTSKPNRPQKTETHPNKIMVHLTANSEVRLSSANPEVHFQQNSVATHNF